MDSTKRGGSDDDDPAPHRPAKRPRQSLFLADSDEDIELAVPPPQDIDIDALFADFDDEPVSLKPLGPSIDENELTRQAEARVRRAMPALTPHQVMPSSSPPRDTEDHMGKDRSGAQEKGKPGDKDEKKARRTIVKLDENRLLGPNGFPHLIKMTKDFKIKGKGHEATDLSRLLQTYQYWTHQLYPKTQFRDTVQRVEKLCHSRRMNVSLSVWRDEAHGRPSKHNNDGTDDDEEMGDGDNADPSPNTEDRDTRIPRSSPSRVSSRSSSPPPYASGPGSDSEMPTQHQPQASNPRPSRTLEEEEQDDFWRSMDEANGDLSDPPRAPTTATNSSMDEGEDMWDIIDEVERAADKSTTATTAEPPNRLDPDDWEDMYL